MLGININGFNIKVENIIRNETKIFLGLPNFISIYLCIRYILIIYLVSISF